MTLFILHSEFILFKKITFAYWSVQCKLLLLCRSVSMIDVELFSYPVSKVSREHCLEGNLCFLSSVMPEDKA